MCRLAGFSGSFPKSMIDKLLMANERGDDDHFYDADEGVGLMQAHRSLSGHELVRSPDGRLVMICIGEIYNHGELLEELERGGASLKGRSRMEMLLQLYHRDGAAMFPKIQGRFALALWDRDAHEVVLACDGTGMEVLYIAHIFDGILFSNDLGAIIDLLKMAGEFKNDGMVSPLSDRRDSSNLLIMKNITRLLPGRAMRVKWGHIEEHWSWRASALAG